MRSGGRNSVQKVEMGKKWVEMSRKWVKVRKMVASGWKQVILRKACCRVRITRGGVRKCVKIGGKRLEIECRRLKMVGFLCKMVAFGWGRGARLNTRKSGCYLGVGSV